MQACIWLASGSPRRGELLEQIGVSYERILAPIDETPLVDEEPGAFVQRMSLQKARAGLEALQSDKHLPVLGSDTAVVLEGRILGKPSDRNDALTMLSALSGKEHQVITGVALVQQQCEECLLQTSTVRFRRLSSEELERYWLSGEPQDKAGSYGIQGLAATFIEHLEGSYSGVMGLPLYETAILLKRFGIVVP